MSQKKLAFVFPPFASDYPDEPFTNLSGFEDCFRKFLSRAAEFADPDLNQFSIPSRTFLDDELKTQYISYIQACALVSWFRQKGVIPAYSSGYSMGIYAALFQSEVISFLDGLVLIRQAYKEIKKITGKQEYGMCSIIGLNQDDIDHLILKQKTTLKLAIQNSVCSFSFSGIAREIQKLAESAQEEGALSTRVLNVSVPYHSFYLKDISEGFSEFVNQMSFRSPKMPIVSLIDQEILLEEHALKNEVVRNLFTSLNWYGTQLYLQELGVNRFVECGSGKGIVKNARFIEGDAVFYTANSFMASFELK
ncbi:MAG: ACP S-malonyltransferase [Bacteroidetes bacterium]|nr:ACP S-malonyltransferase [Bacteroidota bacterium]